MGAAGQDSGCNSVKTEQQEEKTMEINIFNTNKKYDVIYADPPWRYNDRKCNGACEHHYDTIHDTVSQRDRTAGTRTRSCSRERNNSEMRCSDGRCETWDFSRNESRD